MSLVRVDNSPWFSLGLGEESGSFLSKLLRTTRGPSMNWDKASEKGLALQSPVLKCS